MNLIVIVISMICNHQTKNTVLAIAIVTREMNTENDEWSMGRGAQIISTYSNINLIQVLRNDKLPERSVRIILSTILLLSPPTIQPRKPNRH